MSPKCILYVEDSPLNQHLVRAIIAPWLDVKLTTAATGAVGLAAGPCDLLMLDLNLPDMCGEEFLLRWRKLDNTKNVPIIVISGDSLADRKEQLMALGVKHFLAKPFDVADLEDAVNRLLPS